MHVCLTLGAAGLIFEPQNSVFGADLEKVAQIIGFCARNRAGVSPIRFFARVVVAVLHIESADGVKVAPSLFSEGGSDRAAQRKPLADVLRDVYFALLYLIEADAESLICLVFVLRLYLPRGGADGVTLCVFLRENLSLLILKVRGVIGHKAQELAAAQVVGLDSIFLQDIFGGAVVVFPSLGVADAQKQDISLSSAAEAAVSYIGGYLGTSAAIGDVSGEILQEIGEGVVLSINIYGHKARRGKDIPATVCYAQRAVPRE